MSINTPPEDHDDLFPEQKMTVPSFPPEDFSEEEILRQRQALEAEGFQLTETFEIGQENEAQRYNDSMVEIWKAKNKRELDFRTVRTGNSPEEGYTVYLFVKHRQKG